MEFLTMKNLTDLQKDELIAQYSQLIVDSMDVKTLEQFVRDTLTDDFNKLSQIELKDEIRYSFDEETLDELIDNVTSTPDAALLTMNTDNLADINDNEVDGVTE